MGKDRSNKSLCEKSMQVMMNVIRLSAFSIAKMSPVVATKKLNRSVERSVTVTGRAMVPQFPGSLRSHEPESTSKPISYLVRPGQMVVSSEEKSVDGMATAYIKKVHDKNRNEKSNASLYILPPPPVVK